MSAKLLAQSHITRVVAKTRAEPTHTSVQGPVLPPIAFLKQLIDGQSTFFRAEPRTPRHISNPSYPPRDILIPDIMLSAIHHFSYEHCDRTYTEI